MTNNWCYGACTKERQWSHYYKIFSVLWEVQRSLIEDARVYVLRKVLIGMVPWDVI